MARAAASQGVRVASRSRNRARGRSSARKRAAHAAARRSPASQRPAIGLDRADRARREVPPVDVQADPRRVRTAAVARPASSPSSSGRDQRSRMIDRGSQLLVGFDVGPMGAEDVLRAGPDGRDARPAVTEPIEHQGEVRVDHPPATRGLDHLECAVPGDRQDRGRVGEVAVEAGIEARARRRVDGRRPRMPSASRWTGRGSREKPVRGVQRPPARRTRTFARPPGRRGAARAPRRASAGRRAPRSGRTVRPR